jgi:hypothetical protein
MDPKTIFASIEKTREDIDAHVRRLVAVRQHPISMPAPLAGMTDTVADVLDAMVVAQVATTIEHLQAINKAQDSHVEKASGNKPAEQPIVDLDPGQYREVDG